MKRIRGIENLKYEDVQILVDKMGIKECFLEVIDNEVNLVVLD